MALATFLACK
ncbi:hypothetical protein MTR67_030312 [Solanum verrucosum]|uniref:Uncharacterized protein n=1 Tax=Solanum verrucosum TaxID=315347 RepID=A0AAF0R5S5_SOLVR|nr:hypothetical protein MTR67_030312 [Solanum verrucosum]